jgi:hypothetical protein
MGQRPDKPLSQSGLPAVVIAANVTAGKPDCCSEGAPLKNQAPITPPSSRVITITEDLGLPLGKCSGKVEPPFSPGC